MSFRVLTRWPLAMLAEFIWESDWPAAWRHIGRLHQLRALAGERACTHYYRALAEVFNLAPPVEGRP